MAKKKENSLNHNFEALKAQMQAKRKLAENRFEISKIEEEVKNEDSKSIVSEISSLSEISSVPVNETKELEEEYVTLNVVEDEKGETQDTIVKNELNGIVDNPNNSEQQIEYTAKKTGVVSDININKIVIKKVEKPEMPKRITYYLKPETIKKIDKFSKASGMGKSEFVQKILDEVLNNLEIEK